MKEFKMIVFKDLIYSLNVNKRLSVFENSNIKINDNFVFNYINRLL